MNICVINEDMHPEYMGGIKRVISILINEWEKACNIIVLSLAPYGTIYQIFGQAKQYIFPNTNSINSNENLNLIKEIVHKHRIDIILQPFTNNTELTQLCINTKEETKIKLICAIHFSINWKNEFMESYFFNKYRLRQKKIEWVKEVLLYFKYLLITKRKISKDTLSYYNHLIKQSDKVVLLTKSHYQKLKELFNNNEINNITYINNPAVLYDIPNNLYKRKKIIWCGRVEYSIKRVDRIIDIWKDIAPKYPDWELVVVGGGYIESSINLCKELNIPNIKFTGSCNPIEYYKKASIVCMTSSTEGLPMVLIEAMQYGCVPIAYKSYSSLQEIIIDKENGFAITPFDKKQYIEKLELLMKDKELRHCMAQKGYESIKRFDHREIARRWIELFHDVLQ